MKFWGDDKGVGIAGIALMGIILLAVMKVFIFPTLEQSLTILFENNPPSTLHIWVVMSIIVISGFGLGFYCHRKQKKDKEKNNEKILG